MAEESVEMIRTFYDAFNRRDFDVVLDVAHPDFEIRPLPALMAMTGEHVKGYEEAKRFWSSFFEGFDEIQIEPREIIEVGEMVVGDLRRRGCGRDGIEVEQFHADLWTFRDGRVAAVEGLKQRPRPSKPQGCRSSALDEKQ
jgi:ketosteroid isomerase-like protein